MLTNSPDWSVDVNNCYPFGNEGAQRHISWLACGRDCLLFISNLFILFCCLHHTARLHFPNSFGLGMALWTHFGQGNVGRRDVCLPQAVALTSMLPLDLLFSLLSSGCRQLWGHGEWRRPKMERVGTLNHHRENCCLLSRVSFSDSYVRNGLHWVWEIMYFGVFLLPQPSLSQLITLL